MPGHVATWIYNGILGNAQGAAGCPATGCNLITDFGITAPGTPFCINDGLTTAQGGYHQLCFGANSLGGGLISYNAYGGAAALPLQYLVNGNPVSGIQGSVALAPPSNTLNKALTITQSLAGTQTSGANLANQISVTNAGLNGGSGFTSSLYIEQDVNSPLVQGGQDTLELHLKVLSPTSASNTNRNYQPLLATGEISVNDGGTGTTISTANGAIYGGGLVSYAHSGATDLLDVNALELNWAIETGASSAIGAGLVIAPQPTHAVRGAVEDADIVFGNQSTTGVLAGILLSDKHGGNPPLDATNGEILTTVLADGTAPSHQLKNFLDFGNYTCTADYFAAINFSVTCTGQVFGGGNTQTLPATANTSWAIIDNLGVIGEVNFVNRQANGGGFDFRQMTGTGTSTSVFDATTGGIYIASSPLATNATQPFVFLPTTAGLPTGVPIGEVSGRGAIVIDTTDTKLCWRIPGTGWKCVVGS